MGAGKPVPYFFVNPREILTLPAPPADAKIAYGHEPRQFGELRAHGSPGGLQPLVITLHGGFWRNQFNLAYMGHLCEALKRMGFATWNLEYRSLGDAGGGWPGTFDDVVAGAAFLKNIAGPYKLDLARTIALGHSAGGQLALYLAARLKLRGLKLRGVIGIGAVADLKRAQETQLGNRVVDLLHAPPAADPMQALPLHTPQRLFCGKEDDIVPIEISRRYVEAAHNKGDDARLIELPGGHFEPVDPRTAQWASIAQEVASLLARSAPH
jgi:pimeloyl-ACP methyl ester carboxylesterase